jgi:hypothetical protein
MMIIMGALLFFTGVYFLYRYWKRHRSASHRLLPPLSQNAGRFEPIINVTEPGIQLEIIFPQIESPLPDVWGQGEDIELAFHLEDAEGKPLTGRVIQLIIGEIIAESSTDSHGNGQLVLTFSEKGLFELQARFNEEMDNENVEAIRNLRIVDYREEIVALFNQLKEQFRKGGIYFSEDATPREIQEAVNKSRSNVSQAVLDLIINIFEEANYSLHTITRAQYKEMYLAQKTIIDNEQDSGI